MYRKLLLAVTFCLFARELTAKDAEKPAVEHCDDFPVEIEFYAGTAPSSEFATKEIGELINGLVEGLGHLIKPTNYTFPEDLFNASFWNINGTADGFGPGPIATLQDQAQPAPANPLSELGKNFKTPEFVKNAFPHSKGGEKSAFGGLNFPVGAESKLHENLTASATQETMEETNNVWGITVPMNALKIELAKIEAGKVSETHAIDAAMLASNKTTKDISKFAQYVDLTEFKIKANDMFIVCLTMAVVRNDKQVPCQRCTMLRVCDSLDAKCAQKFVTLRAPDSKVHPYAASLQYWILDPPLSDIKLLTKVRERAFDARCAGANETTKALEKTNKLFPNAVVHVDIPNLSPKLSYTVEASLVITWGEKYKVPFGWSNPLIIPNYLDGKDEFVIYACGDNPAAAKPARA